MENRDRWSKVPRGGWCVKEELEAGGWSFREPVEVPACYGLELGVWYQIREGVKGIVVRSERGELRVYVLTETASHYCQVMTRANRMPVLISDRI